jgi:hypothetical protein
MMRPRSGWPAGIANRMLITPAEVRPQATSTICSSLPSHSLPTTLARRGGIEQPASRSPVSSVERGSSAGGSGGGEAMALNPSVVAMNAEPVVVSILASRSDSPRS